MTRIEQLFSRKSSGILNVYCTAGFPQLNDTMKVITALQKNGVDLIELGMPYSDPLADGPVIQESSSKAIENGMTIATLFQQLKDLRRTITVPVVMMGYMNPVMQYGFENFCGDAKAVGIDGFILPDMPLYEYNKTYKAILQQYGLDLVFLVTPETSDERIKQIDAMSSGFLYAVSSSSTTGSNKDLSQQDQYFERLHSMKLTNPVLIGFGIKDKESFDHACKYANGAIIGTAFIKALSTSNNLEATIEEFVGNVLGRSAASVN